MDDKNLSRWMASKKARRAQMEPDKLFSGIERGDIATLSLGITLVESSKVEDRERANQLIQRCLTVKNESVRIGITGVPGVGKSTFIESFGQHLVEQGKRVAVLAVDPSSSVSKGSILGDKTRMQNLSMMENVFIRPSAAGDTLGGVARKTRESIILCEAAGFDVILIETVGVGQSETVVKSMVDFFLLLMLSGAGDELQGIKKGIMEMADALVITKSDGDNIKRSNVAAREYRNALHLFPPNENDWIPEVFTCSSLSNNNIDRVFEVVKSFENKTRISGWFRANRQEQDVHWLLETLKELIIQGFFNDPELLSQLREVEGSVKQGKLSSFQGAEKLYHLYKNGKQL